VRDNARRSLGGFVAAACLALWPVAQAAAPIPVASALELNAALRTANPGDTIVLAAGEWRDAAIEIKAGGTADAPLTVTAVRPGGARFTGRSRLRLLGEHLVISGLVFAEGDSTGDPIITIRGAHNRLTDTAIVRFNPREPGTRYPWVQVHGRGHRIDHNRFEGQNHSGVTLQIVVGEGDNRLRINHNHFLDRTPGTGNGFESLQLGQSQDSLKPARALVEDNLFESCDGEVEVVSNKSCENTYRRNTFWRCAGTLTLRHGDRCVVEGNMFLGDGKKGAGGIRIIGRDHIVRGNYLERVSDETGGVIAIYAGIPDSPLNGYFAADRALVGGNWLLGTRGACFNLSAGLGERGRTVRPTGVRVVGNWIIVDYSMPFSNRGTWALGGELQAGSVVADNHIGTAPVDGPASIRFGTADGFALSDTPPDRAQLLAQLKPVSATEVGPTWWSRE
jgi:poly(beta-D-mannuronate) lyase